VPEVDGVAGLDELFDAGTATRLRPQIDNQRSTMGQDFAVERPLLRPQAAERFEAGWWVTPPVDR
jgi:hypothetical protein